MAKLSVIIGFKKGNNLGKRFQKGNKPLKHKDGCVCFLCTKKPTKYWSGKKRPDAVWKHLPHYIGEKNHEWKGEEAGYVPIHVWVQRWKGKPGTCEKCGRTGLSGKMIHWANIDHKYRRVLDDYIRLCAKCHYAYDRT